MISVIIPSYGRAGVIAERVKNIQENTYSDLQVLVIAEKEQLVDYSDELHAEFDMPWTWLRLFGNKRSKNYAGAVNTAITQASGNYLFFGADDLSFHSGWDLEALKVMTASPTVKVVGTNDLLNEFVLQGWHSTHHLVDRSYLEEPGGVVDGGPGDALFEGYDHNFVDTEFIGTAKARAVFSSCLASVVEHLHWSVGKSPQDGTSEKAYLNFQSDAELYESRKHLWWDLSR